MRRTAWRFAMAAMAICTAGTASAQTDMASEEDFFAAIPTVYSATRLNQSRRETPASVSVITREMIEASPALEIPDLLRLVPGFQVAHANGNLFAPTYHGNADQYPRAMEVLIDGRSVYLPSISAVEWAALGLAIEDIERIEVVRSPNAATYGNNAIRGSINIVTRQPFLLRGPYARLTVGDIGTRNGVLRYGGRLAELDASLTLQYREDDGFDNVDDHKRIGDLRFHGTYQPDAVNAWDFQFGLLDGEVGAWGEPDDVFNPPRDRTVRANYLLASWQHTKGPNEHYRVSLALNHHVHDDLFQAPSVLNPGATFTFGSYDADMARYDLEFEHRFRPRDDLRLVWGLGGRYDRLEAQVALGDRDRVSEFSWRLFANAEWRPVPELIVNAGAMTSFRQVAKDYTSPRLGVNWRFAPHQTLRASASRSYYVSTLYQQYANYWLVDTAEPPAVVPYIVSTGPGAAPEEFTAYEIGYLREWPQHGLTLDLKLFREHLHDEGFAERVESNPFELPIVWGDEGGRWDTKGAEVELRYGSPRGAQLSLAYAYAQIEGTRPEAADAEFRPIDFRSYDDTVPRHTFAAQLSHRLFERWDAALAVYYVDDMRWRGLGDAVDGYTRVDIKLQRKWQIGPNWVGVGLIVHNLFDDTYQEFTRQNDLGRRAYLQLMVE